MSNSTDQERLEKRVGESMNGLLYTYKTHYKMAEYYEKWDRRFKLSTAGGTGILAGAILWGGVPRSYLMILALLVAVLSWINTSLDWGSKSMEHYSTGDKYHSLFEEFRDYVELCLSTDDPFEKKKERYEELSIRRKELNMNSPRTTNKRYAKLDQDEVFDTMETTQDELDRLLNTAEKS